jgi:BirA family biotin operon repressor/biotin-[acetyl-CoA-carboxylase] ligase
MLSTHLLTLIDYLSDGQYHSGEDLGLKLGISRSAIWKLIHQAGDLGLDIASIHGKGYCIPGGIEFFSHQHIENYLDKTLSEQLKCFDILSVVDSTNRYLMEKVKTNQTQNSVCLAEYQTAGRGRNSRSWISPFGKNIYLSLLWCFSGGTSALTGLTLSVGLAIVRALQKYGIENVGLKWPNDVYASDRKLAGTLVEIYIDSMGFCHVVIGIGINLAMTQRAGEAIEQQWTDIATLTSEKPRKNYLTALLLNELLHMLPNFEREGFAAYRDGWRNCDILLNKPITVHTLQGDIDGIAEGIDEQGGLLVRNGNQFHHFSSGDVSVRWK